MGDWQGDAREEQGHLIRWINRLRGFLDTPAYAGLGEVEQQLCLSQLRIMNAYCDLLNERIARF